MNWTWQPIFSPLQIGALALALTALAVYGYARTWRRRPWSSLFLLAMRLVTVAACAVILLGPSWTPPAEGNLQRPTLSILLDTSSSMLTEDVAGHSRIASAVTDWLTPDTMQALDRDFQVRLWSLGTDLTPISIEKLRSPATELASASDTFLAEHVRSAVWNMEMVEEGDAMLILSDGHDTQEGMVASVAPLAKAKRLPIYAIGLGGLTEQPDVLLTAIPQQEYLLPRELGAIQVRIYQSGYGNQHVKVHVTNGDQDAEYPVTLLDNEVTSLQVPIQQSEEGLHRYDISVEPLENERDSTNNLQTVFCDVEKRRIRILMLEGQPFWDSKFLAQSLRKDERIEITQVSQISSSKRETIVTRVDDTASQVPQTLEAWTAFDIVLLGRSVEHVLNVESAQQLCKFVGDHGGHVVFTRGRPWSNTEEGLAVAEELAEILPVDWGNETLNQLKISLDSASDEGFWFTNQKMGQSMETAFPQLPGFESMHIVQRTKPATLVLAEASSIEQTTLGSQPAIVSMSYGRGNVVGILGEGTWRWSLLPPEQESLLPIYDTFWSNLMRWLAMGGDFQPGRDVTLQLNRTTTRRADGAIAEILCKRKLPEGTQPMVRLVKPDKSSETVPLEQLPGRIPRYRANLSFTGTGLHTVTLDVPGSTTPPLERLISVYDIDLERLQVSAQLDGLKQLAAESGGRFFSTQENHQLATTLRRDRASLQAPPHLEYAWDSPPWMVLLLCWMGLEWILRRTADML